MVRKGGRKVEQLDLLWEYQELEKLMDRYRQERDGLSIRNELRKLQRYLMQQQNKLVKLDEEANKKSNTLNKIYHEYDTILNSLRIDQEKIENGSIKNIKQAEQLEKNAQNLKDKLSKKEEQLTELIEELEEFSKVLKDIGINVSKGKREYTKVKAQYDEQAGDIQKKYNEAKAKRDALKKKIDKELLSKYKELKANYDEPIALVTEQYCCSGCNMQIASLALQNLKEGTHIIECENCGRILYLKRDKVQAS